MNLNSLLPNLLNMFNQGGSNNKSNQNNNSNIHNNNQSANSGNVINNYYPSTYLDGSAIFNAETQQNISQNLPPGNNMLANLLPNLLAGGGGGLTSLLKKDTANVSSLNKKSNAKQDSNTKVTDFKNVDEIEIE